MYLTGNLTKNQIVALQVNRNERRTTLALLQVCLRKRQYDDVARNRFARAESSSGVSQSRARTASLAIKPSKVSPSDFSLKKRAKS